MTRQIIKPTRSVTEDGIIEWRLNGQLHRIDGPAYEWSDGYKAWYFMGRLHREDGPAIIDSHKSYGYYLMGYQMTKEEYLRADASKYPRLQVYQIMHE